MPQSSYCVKIGLQRYSWHSAERIPPLLLDKFHSNPRLHSLENSVIVPLKGGFGDRNFFMDLSSVTNITKLNIHIKLQPSQPSALNSLPKLRKVRTLIWPKVRPMVCC